MAIEKPDTRFSEITILPDGRIFAFGTTLPILEALACIPTLDEKWKQRLPVAQTEIVEVSLEKPCE